MLWSRLALACRRASFSRSLSSGRALAAVALMWLTTGPGSLADVNMLELSAGIPPPLGNINVMLVNAGPGSVAQGEPPGSPNFNSSANFGDLAQVTDGSPAQGAVGLRVRGGVPYVLTVSQVTFTSTNLQAGGVDLSGASDRGSFIRVTVGRIVGSGPGANPGGSQINPILLGRGLTLNQIAFGTANPGSTIVISGDAPSVGAGPPGGVPGPPPAGGPPDVVPGKGPPASLGAVEVPVFFTLPTGLALGPTDPRTPGTFMTQLQFGVFPQL